MLRLTVSLLCCIVLANSIKVPTTWDDYAQVKPFKPKKSISPSQASNPKLKFEVPTGPIYPGKGVWAKPARFKYRPFIREDHLTTYPPLQKDDYLPDGYEIYNQGLRNFNKIRSNLNQNGEKYQKPKEENVPQSSDINEDFIPTRLYAQVRKTEEENHVPRDEEEPRLREVIKDSRIHIVYTEEGYEDGEYDHGDHEKKAESHQGFQHDDSEHDGSSSFGKRIKYSGRKIKPANLKKIDDKTAHLIMADVNKHIKRSKRSTQEKYPYYNNTSVDQNSPLRYALDLQDIPGKNENSYVIYNDEGKPCEEPAGDINPVPQRVEKGEAKSDDDGEVDLPRLKNLGDKIDCLKTKYFGKQPLDSPIFSEELVESPKPLFKGRQGKSIQAQNSTYEELPEASELRMRRRRRRPIKRHHPYNLKYQPQSPINIYTTTPYPNRYTISEVFYKDDIKPNEQLNVFADVINNIKNSSRETFIASSDIIEQDGNFHRPTIPPRKIGKIQPSRFNRVPPEHARKKSNFIKQQKSPFIHKSQKFVPHCAGKFCSEQKKFSPNSPIHLAASEQNFVSQAPEDPAPVLKAKTYQTIDASTSDYSTIDIPMNKYIVPGMKPPSPLEKPYIYSDFQITPEDFTAQRRLFRIRRSTSKLSYAEIKRPKPLKTSDDENGEDEPHRLANVYYDLKSDMVVYKEKSRASTEEPKYVEEEYDEIEVETEKPVKTTTSRPHRTVYHKDVLNKENGLTLVDFLAKLRASPGYVAIPDPEPTKKPTTTTTIAPEQTSPPQFLAFLQNLHNNPTYVKYEDKDVKASTTTTEKIEEDNEEDEEEEDRPVKLQNSPGGQFRPFEEYEGDSEEVTSKNFSPRTSIDYSKYKTIERSTIKNRIDDEEDDNEPTSNPPKIQSTTTTPPPSTTTTKRTIKIRGRKRPQTTTPKISTTVVTRRTTRSTISDDVSSTTQKSSVPRVYRRPRPKVRIRPTTPSIEREANTEEVQRSQRRIKKIHVEVPVNHKPLYTPLQDRIDTETMVHVDYKKPRLITPDILSYNNSMKGDDVPGRISPRSYDVEVFKNYDRQQKHGGNYRRKGEKYHSFYNINHNYNPNKLVESSTGNIVDGSRSRETLEDFDTSKESLEETTNSSTGSSQEIELESQEVEGNGESNTEASKDYDFDDEVKILFNPGANGKKVFIIKNPNRRRYIYAPV